MKTRLIFMSALLIGCGVLFSQTEPQPESAEVILNRAYKQAAREKKNVFVSFHASWCGWCKKLDASINDPSCSEYFNNNFVFVHLTVLESKDKKNLENPGAPEMYSKYSGGKAGIPFFLIFDKKGKLLADSFIRKPGDDPDKPGQNVGCPATDDEISAFVEILKKTSNIGDNDIKAIQERFSKNRN
ncbi:MAG TPA: thioredoxin family protein [Bacteroidales bacterium]|nr:thioredoxin family protein [Bacteroidales bacterium]HRW86658.1 thioredoxin family protein [Bacteroidales bacterium]